MPVFGQSLRGAVFGWQVVRLGFGRLWDLTGIRVPFVVELLLGEIAIGGRVAPKSIGDLVPALDIGIVAECRHAQLEQLDASSK
jgi:hypothetical protein